MSAQWAHVTLHIPGTDETGGVTGLGAKLIIRLQFGRGHAIRCDELLQISKQLHGHRTYFLPGGAFRIGCKKMFYFLFDLDIKFVIRCLTVASLHWLHLTTCCSLFNVMSIIAWHTRHVTIGTPPVPGTWYGGGRSSGPIAEVVCCKAAEKKVIWIEAKILQIYLHCAWHYVHNHSLCIAMFNERR